MNTIKSYLDNMFRNLPNTAEVRKAKNELLQMMEDKFEELKAEGKSENEAVGIVISEFGNLDEIAQSIGILEQVKESADSTKPMLTIDRIKEYLATVSLRSQLIPLGIALCIMSVTAPILFGDILGGDASTVLNALGVVVFFIMIAAGVVCFVISASRNGDFEDINEKQVSLGIESAEYVRNERNRFKATYSTMVSIGIALCIISIVMPVIIDAMPFINNDFGGILFFFAVAVGVFLIVTSNVRMNAYDRLLKLNESGKMSEEFIPKADRKINKAPIVIGIVVAVAVIGIGMVLGILRLVNSFRIDPSRLSESEYSFTEQDGELNTIDIDASAMSVVIRESGTVEYVDAYYSGDTELTPDVYLENGVLKISQNADNIDFNWGMINDGPELIIEVSPDVDLADLVIDMDAGDFDITGMSFDKVTGVLDAGDLQFNNCSIGQMDIETDAGNIECTGGQYEDICLNSDAGNIEIDRVSFDNLAIDASFGDIEVNSLEDISSYTIDVSCDAGSVEVDGSESFGSYHSEGTGSGTITIDCNAGSVEIKR